MLKRFFLLTILVVLFLVLALPALAATTIDSATFACNQIQLSYSAADSGGLDFAIITVTNDDTATVIYYNDSVYSPFGDTININFPAQPEGSNLSITVESESVDSRKGICTGLVTSGGSAGLGGNAPDYNEIAFGDGRFCFGRGEADTALFPFRDGLVIYRLNGDDGELALLLTAEDLAEQRETNFQIASSADGFIRLYRLTTGQYQVNVGPDEEGKVHVCIFGAIPDTSATTFSYILD